MRRMRCIFWPDVPRPSSRTPLKNLIRAHGDAQAVPDGWRGADEFELSSLSSTGVMKSGATLR